MMVNHSDHHGSLANNSSVENISKAIITITINIDIDIDINIKLSGRTKVKLETYILGVAARKTRLGLALETPFGPKVP